jgi:glycosyltransferase involved in cell wall biosynthesis
MVIEQDVGSNAPPIRVLHLIDSGGFYGAERVLIELMVGQRELGAEPFLLSVGESRAQVYQKPVEVRAQALGLKVITWRGKTGFNPALRQYLATLGQSGDFAVFHSHGYKFDVLLASLPRRVGAAVWVSTVHGYVAAPVLSKMNLYQWLDKQALRRFEHVVCVSEAMQRKLSSRLHPRCIVNGIGGIPVIDSLASKVTEFLSDKSHCLMIVGRLAIEKGHARLLRVLSRLKAEYPAIGLVVFGEGPLQGELEGLVKRLALEDQVLFFGYCDGVAGHFSQFDLMVMPSETEGLPITLLEAVEAQIPVVASAVGGIPEVLGEGYPGLSLTDDNHLFECIRHQLESPPDYSAREQLRQRVQGRFGYLRMAREYLDCYTDSAGAQNGSR